MAQKEHEQIYPKPGWVEHDVTEIWDRTQEVVDEAVASAGASAGDIAAVGITNQRETTVVWDRNTGEPIHNAMVWQDTRTDKLVDESRQGRRSGAVRGQGRPAAGDLLLRAEGPLDAGQRRRRPRSRGRRRSAVRQHGHLAHLEPHGRHGRRIAHHGSDERQPHDADEPGRLTWNEEIAGIMGVPTSMLPEIKASSEVYGDVSYGGALNGVPIAGDLGDQQAATFGQTCFSPGEAKNTYGTGNFLLLNTGTEAVQSKNGMLTTVGYKIGDEAPVYCLEGAIAITGALVQWLRDNLKMIKAAPEVEELAQTVEDNGGCYVVPAFSGLFAPYWKSNARGVIAGLTRYVNAGHIARATLEATAYQSREVVEAMNADSGVALESLKVDGGMVAERPADAVPGRPARRAGHPAAGGRDDRARRGLRGRARDGPLGQPGGPARELGRGQALGADDGLRQARRVLQVLEEGRDADLRLVRGAEES